MKLFITEKGSDKMIPFYLAEDDRNKVISAIAQVEARSAICRLGREKRITADEATLAIDILTGESRRMVEQPITPPVLEVANKMVERHFLRSMDAVQLGSAIVARDILAAPDMRFLSSDNELKQAAITEGFNVWDPLL